MHELIDALGIGEVAQTYCTEVLHAGARRQVVADEVDHGLRQQHLAAMRGAHDARGTVDDGAEQVVAAALDHARMQAAADAQLDALGGRRIGERGLQRDRSLQRLGRIAERGIHAVAGHLDHHAATSFDCRAAKLVVMRQRGTHPFGRLLPQPGAALDVGEQDGGAKLVAGVHGMGAWLVSPATIPQTGKGVTQ